MKTLVALPVFNEAQHVTAVLDEVLRYADHDIVSGSRYLSVFDDDSAPPEDRWKINRIVTAELNRLLQLQLTDAFCGFKAYRVDRLSQFTITEPGYAMPLELWVEAAAGGLRIRELAVPLIYLEEKRSFGGGLDHAETRLRHYRDVIARSAQRQTMPNVAPSQTSSATSSRGTKIHSLDGRKCSAQGVNQRPKRLNTFLGTK